jgi:hypothetical protein
MVQQFATLAGVHQVIAAAALKIPSGHILIFSLSMPRPLPLFL